MAEGMISITRVTMFCMKKKSPGIHFKLIAKKSGSDITFLSIAQSFRIFIE